MKRNSYAPYGEAYAPTAIDGTGYTGHVMDQATGLTYMQQRYYDPQIGRFLSVDPIPADRNSGANFNNYWYVNNNPYRFTDPDGRAPGGCGIGHCDQDSIEARRAAEERRRRVTEMRREDQRSAHGWTAQSLGRRERESLAIIVSANEGLDLTDVSVQVNMMPGSNVNTMLPGVVILSDDAFSSRSMLASVLIHEIGTHWKQIQRNRGSYKTPLQGARWEATAWRRDLQNAKRLGNSAAEIRVIKSQYDTYKVYGEEPEDLQ